MKKIFIALLLVSIIFGCIEPEPLIEPTTDCTKITSTKNIEECIGKEVQAIGILECKKEGVEAKAGVHFLKFEDKTELKFLEEYKECKLFDGKKVQVTAELYECGAEGRDDQCAGIGLNNIKSIEALEPVQPTGEPFLDYFNASTCKDDPYEDNKIKEKNWLDSTTLEVKAKVSVNCADEILGGDFGLEGNKIVLKYTETDNEEKMLCLCAHDLTYRIKNLEKKEYEFELERIIGETVIECISDADCQGKVDCSEYQMQLPQVYPICEYNKCVCGCGDPENNLYCR